MSALPTEPEGNNSISGVDTFATERNPPFIVAVPPKVALPVVVRLAKLPSAPPSILCHAVPLKKQ